MVSLKVFIFSHVCGMMPWFYPVVLLLFLTIPTARAQFSLPAPMQFLEEQKAGTYVGNVAMASGLPEKVSKEVLNRLEYKLQESSNSYFEVSKELATMKSTRRIDRDTICAGESTCVIPEEVLVYKVDADSYDLFKVIKVEVEIIDINDNAPEFPAKSVALSVPEGNAPNQELRTSSAEDEDVGVNDVEAYRLEQPSDMFSLKVHINQDGSSYLGIVIREELDRETRDFYQVVIIATDGGRDNRLTGSVLINITVTDLNDNDPEFEQSAYNVSVPEDIRVNVPIVRLTATDRDIGRNAEISYKFSPQVAQDVRRVFYIDEQTGEIFARTELDFERDRRYQLVAIAEDQGAPPNSARVSVTLHVTDVNDNSPRININLPPQGTDLSEAEPVGKFVVHVSVADSDQGDNAKITCGLDDGHFSLERFGDQESNMYKVVLARPLDHEKFASHRVTITCSDSGQPPRLNSTTFVVNVTDVNDMRPVFEEDTYVGIIPENHAGPVEVLTVKANDLDSGDMGRITYSLEDRYNGLFEVDSVTGIITATRPVDRESGPSSLEFHVMARDNGPDRLTSSALVVVEVKDENDEPPSFSRADFFGEVLENQLTGTLVGNVTATDPDSPQHRKIRYAILPQGTDFGKFWIDPESGVLKTAAVFDREQKDRYHFTIQAQDPDKSEFYSTCNFTVRILDENDHSPVITDISSRMPVTKDGDDGSVGSVDPNNATFIVQYSAPVGAIIAAVVAYDGDDPTTPNAQLSYALSEGNHDNLFSMDRFSGSLVLARVVTAKDINTFKLLAAVSDGGSPPKSDSQNIYVRVNGSVAALTSASSGGLSQNILIVIILICVTVVLALAILATICLIRKIDRQRRRNRAAQKLSEDKMYQLTEQPSGYQHSHNNHRQDVFPNSKPPGQRDGEDRERRSPGADISSNCYSNNLGKRGGGGGGGKKEVSFSLDEETDSHNTSSGSGQPLTSFKGGGVPTPGAKPAGSRPMRNGVMNIPVSGEKPSNLRRSPQNECQLIEILKKSAEDALSDSSGETDPSDSGRGGSEDECSHRGSGFDPEHANGRYSQHREHRSPLNVKDKDQQQHRQQKQLLHQNHHDNNNRSSSNNNNLHQAGPSRHLSSPLNSSAPSPGTTASITKGRPLSRVLEPMYGRGNPRDSLTSDFGSDLSGSRPPSQSRTDSDRSVPPPPAPRPARELSVSQMLPFTRPSFIPSSTSSSPSARDTQSAENSLPPSSRAFLARDASRLPHPESSSYNSNSLMRSFHGQRSGPNRLGASQQPGLSSVSMERLPRSSSLSSSPITQAGYYPDQGPGAYSAVPDRWERRSSIVAEEDDRTTTSGSYTINTDDLRQEMDEIVLQDSIV